jgi:diguanylate cyclase
MKPEYSQSRDESVTLLKVVIAEMNQHEAPFTPITYAVCYEHLAGINPRLSEAFAQAKAASPHLASDTMARLYRDFVAPADDEAAEIARSEFQRVMREIAASAARTGESARAYGSKLEGLSRALEDSEGNGDTAALTPHLSEVAGDTTRMQSVVAALAKSVSDSEREVERLREALERTRIEASTDPLSKLLNRAGFDKAMREVLCTPAPHGMAHCLAIFDIDHFKRVNDTYGHPVGDTVIETVGQVLGRVASGPNQFAARIGGEEFAVLMRATTVAQALHVAQAVRALVATMKIKKRGTQEVIASVTISAGIAARDPGDDAASLIAAADAALYRAKEAGRDRVMVA